MLLTAEDKQWITAEMAGQLERQRQSITAEVAARLEEAKQSITAEVSTKLEEAKQSMRSHVATSVEGMETKLLTAFHGWARSMELRVRGLSFLDERMTVAEERISELERKRDR